MEHMRSNKEEGRREKGEGKDLRRKQGLMWEHLRRCSLGFESMF